jgi:hypothetical protein
MSDELFRLICLQAKLRGTSMSKVVEDLVRRGLSAPTPSEEEGGLTVFRLPADSPRVTTDDVRRIEAEGA